ncbi:MAG: DUF480 domain-containing protein [Planctomycetes bacterium]|nr:DUF480 domain-containing protein [Planctomycetota bacterium]
MQRLDRTEQRITGVLIEKQLSVPDSYPMSENALVDGCNQKNNRDPVTELVSFQIAGALMSMQEKGFVARVEGAGRVAKFKHRVVEELHVDNKDLAILAELLLRGPQAPGALKPRVARMGLHASPEEIEAMLRRLGERKPALVELLPLGPRERDRRWRHLIGDGSEFVADEGAASAPPSSAHGTSVAAAVASPDLESRIATLERQVAALQATIVRLTSPGQGG